MTTNNGGLLRIQPRTNRIIGKAIPVGYGDWQMVPSPRALWVTSYGSGNCGTVTRVDLATGAVKNFGNLTEVNAAGAGSLWTSQVQRVDPNTGNVIASVLVPGAAPQVTFWKGSVWALTVQHSLTFLQIDPATNQVTGKPVPVGKPLPPAAAWSTEPAAIAAGPTGLWVLDFMRNLLFHLVMKPAKS